MIPVLTICIALVVLAIVVWLPWERRWPGRHRAVAQARVDLPVMNVSPMSPVRCFLCDPQPAAPHDGLCPTCRLLVDAYDEVPIPFWPVARDGEER